MRRSSALWLRYGGAILITAGLMIWQSGDTVRAGTATFGDTAVFWLLSVTAGWLQMIIIARGVRSAFGTDTWPGWALLLAGAVLGAVPLTFEVRWLVAALIPPETGMPPPWVTFVNVTVINVVFSVVQYTLIERWPLGRPDLIDAEADDETGPRAEQGGQDTLPTVSKLSRRPEGLNGVIRFMRMDDHYLHIHTDHGAGLVLHRMADAARDLTGTDGIQVHKSWWVARHAVTRSARDGRRRFLVLTDGTEIPVGRSFEKTLRDEGWM